MFEVSINSNQSTLSTRAVAKRHQSTTRASRSNETDARADSSMLLARSCKCFRRAEKRGRESALFILQTGRHLTRVKERLPHGEFGASVAKHCPFKIRSAERYMRLFRIWDALPAEKRRKVDFGAGSLRGLESAIKSVSTKPDGPDDNHGQQIDSGAGTGQPCVDSTTQLSQQSSNAESVDTGASKDKLTFTKDESSQPTFDNSPHLTIYGCEGESTEATGSKDDFTAQDDQLRSQFADIKYTVIAYRDRCRDDDTFRERAAGSSPRIRRDASGLRAEIDALLTLISSDESQQQKQTSAAEKSAVRNSSPRASWEQDKLRGRGPKPRPKF